MSGKIFVISLGLFTFAFACCLYYFQVFAYYEESEPLSYLMVGTRTIPVTNYRGIDSSSSGLKLRGCFEVNPSDFVGLPKPEKATPLSAPFWFLCIPLPLRGMMHDSGLCPSIQLYSSPILK